MLNPEEEFACGSISINKVFISAAASNEERFIAVVVYQLRLLICYCNNFRHLYLI